MIALEIRFIAGQYHATPWGRHVNEGAVEWPPSPWRLLRALIAVGYRKLGWDPRHPPQEAAQLVELLAAEVPVFHLPPASLGHTRHYMPKYNSARDGKTDKVFDALEAFEKIAGDKGCTLSQFALAWCADQPGITSPIIGPRTPDQLKDNLGAVTVQITEEDSKRVDEIIAPGTAALPYYELDQTVPKFKW